MPLGWFVPDRGGYRRLVGGAGGDPSDTGCAGAGAGGDASETGRSEAFSDAVLAIVITLLVLDLRVPETEPGRMLAGLLDQWPGYTAYVASYLYVAVVWLNHKIIFRWIRATDRGLNWANLFILFSTALLPFPTALVSRALQEGNLADERTAVASYAIVGALLCGSWWVFFHYLLRRRDLLREDVDPRLLRLERTRSVVGLALYALGGVLGYLAVPLIALAVFLVLPVFYGVSSASLYETRLARRSRSGG